MPTVFNGDCREVLATMPDASADAIVTDPPYELGFMGKGWDASGIAYDTAMWVECLRVLKPGGHLLAFGGTRTYHRMAVAVEDAGFEIRDSIMWIYGSGFPKSLDVSKAIDKAAGATREVVGTAKRSQNRSEGWDRPWMREQMAEVGGSGMASHDITAPATPDAARWSGWGTALKPAHEPIVVARKPLIGTVAANVLAHGTGALNVDGCRVAGEKAQRGLRNTALGSMNDDGWQPTPVMAADGLGRWPANVVFDEDAAAELDAQTGDLGKSQGGSRGAGGQHGAYSAIGAQPDVQPGFGDTGGASRFFYCAKAPAAERPVGADGTKHPTVKPLTLMRWLVRLITPPGGVVLDPFAGSGTTLEAAELEGFRSVGVEADAKHCELIAARLAPYRDAA